MRKEFETIVASAPREKMKRYDLSRNTTIAAGQTEFISIYSPPGTISKVLAIVSLIPALIGVTNGGSNWLYVDYPDSILDLITVSGANGSEIRINNNQMVMGSNPFPTDPIVFQNTIMNITFDDSIPLRLVYQNGTDVNTGISERIYSIYAIEKTVG